MDIVSKLREFNEFWDAFILEAIKPLAILSMGLGTVAVFNVQGLAIQPAFVTLWAIVQALSIDGLFFATWEKLWQQKLRWANALAIAGLIVIGIVLALIAVAINAVLGFQVLWSIADSSQAMAKLGISSALLVIVRAILAIVVFIMISFVRAKARDSSTTAQVIVVSSQAKTVANPRAKKAKVTVTETEPLAIPAQTVSPDGGLTEMAKTGKYELIKEAMANAAARGEKINYHAIAEETEAGYSTVKLYGSQIKQELGIK